MSTKRRYVIDGQDFATLEGFYDEISRVLIPQVLWGRNLDAFNDILRGGFGTPGDGFILEWRNSSLSREKLGYSETVRQLEHRLSRCHSTARNTVAAQLELAHKGLGPTVFDWLIEIIRTHGEGGRQAEDNIELQLL